MIRNYFDHFRVQKWYAIIPTWIDKKIIFFRTYYVLYRSYEDKECKFYGDIFFPGWEKIARGLTVNSLLKHTKCGCCGGSGRGARHKKTCQCCEGSGSMQIDGYTVTIIKN